MKNNSSYFLTLTVVDWIDVFTRKNHKDALIESLRYCIKHKGLNVYAYCLMTNHLHLIVNCDEPFELKDTIRDFKRHTVKQLLFQIQNDPESRREWMIELFKQNGENHAKSDKLKFWKTGNHAIELYTEKFVWDKINYIHNNPVEEKFVTKPEHWIYSSASNYIYGNGILEEVHCLPGVLIDIK
ncbi:MAG: transposase [Crocinitomicaceae bacterium]